MTTEALPKLSRPARALWAKSDYGEGDAWLPLYVHMYDSARVADRLWDAWIPRSTREMLGRSLGERADLARPLVVFLAAAHDLGKATPAFQAAPASQFYAGDASGLMARVERAGLPFSLGVHVLKAPRHPIAGQVILERALVAEGVEAPAARCLSSIIGCHHGMPPDDARLIDASENKPTDLGFDSDAWLEVQREVLLFATHLADVSLTELAQVARGFLPPYAASVITGVVIMTDWIASNQDLFPLVPSSAREGSSRFADDDGNVSRKRLDGRFEAAWSELGLLPCWQEPPLAPGALGQLFAQRFRFPEGAHPRPVQAAALEVASRAAEPGLLVIEAPMGEGKTEAALAAAEELAARAGCGGVCVALPTMATTDAMFGRVHEWLRRLPQPEGARAGSIYLAHGKARLNEEFQGIARAGGAYGCIGSDLSEGQGTRAGARTTAVVSDWMSGRKRGVLANFVVCTVDQVLMGALQMKHLPLRQLALANKVVIIDECHAYDAYMRQYLCDVLEWMGSWHTPVILLSATLPEGQRSELVRAYLRGRQATQAAPSAQAAPMPGLSRFFKVTVPPIREPDVSPAPAGAYPLLTYTDGTSVEYRAVAASARDMSVRVCLMPDDIAVLADTLASLLTEGGCAGVICDTVGRAQETYAALAERFGRAHVSLTHARFTDMDRMANEASLRAMLGPKATRENGQRPELHVVVGTQVLEQSLDIDFDVLVTDFAPVDLLFQRLGRMHRHAREGRPRPLEEPVCLVRGVASWEEEIPRFAGPVERVYERASLMEALAACGLTDEGREATLELPADIARLVRLAYGPHASELIPEAWRARYAQACEGRCERLEEKRRRAQYCLLKGVAAMCRDRNTLTNWYDLGRMVVETDATRDADRGPRAVRDTQETVEVMALRVCDGEVRLLPWIGDEPHGVAKGAPVATTSVPEPAVARVAAQSTVRLPLSLCRAGQIDRCIEELEAMDGPYAGAWQESPWLQGQLALLLRANEGGELSAELCGYRLTYSREMGLREEKIAEG